jgi:hypothetical protein
MAVKTIQKFQASDGEMFENEQEANEYEAKLQDMPLKLYRISQSVNNDYDTYDSAVVVARTEDEAQGIRPGGGDWDDGCCFQQWAASKPSVDVVYLGEASGDLENFGEINCASYNAG